MRLLLLAAIAGCTHPIAIHAPGGYTTDPRWVVTSPAITGNPYPATAGDHVYTLDCSETPTVREIGGDAAWTAGLGTSCYVAEHAQPIAASERGVVVAMGIAGGIRMAAFDGAGTARWTRMLGGDVRAPVVAAFGERTAVCAMVGDTPPVVDGTPIPASFGTAMALVLDGRGALVEHHAIEHVNAPIACSFDRDGELWAIATLGRQVTVDGRGRDLASATYAVRLTGGTRVIRLFAEASTWATAMPDGFAIATYDRSVAFADRDGKQRWRLAVEGHGCTLSIAPIAAASDHLLAGLWVLCGQRHGSVRLGDLELVDQTDPEGDLAEGNFVAVFDPIAGKALGAYRVDRSDTGLHFLPTGDGFLLTGWFEGDLGLGTRIRSRPDEYNCLSNLPTDARTWSSYETDRPSCRSGFRLRTSQPHWPFIARFVLPAR